MSEIKVNIRPMKGAADIEAYIGIMSRALLASYAAFVPVPDLELWIAQNLTLTLLTEKLYNPKNRQFGFVAEDPQGKPVGIVRLYVETPANLDPKIAQSSQTPNYEMLLSSNIGPQSPIRTENDRFYVGSLYVDPLVKGSRIGSQLMTFSETLAKSFGVKFAWINCMKENHSVRDWYARLGYEYLEDQTFQWPIGNARPICLTGRKSLS